MTRRDCWAEWLLHRRCGGDEELHRRLLPQLLATRDRVLDRAELREGETLLDVGCGDGLIAFGALDRGAGRVIFSDVSQDLLDESRRLAEEAGALDRCRFVRAGAEDLSELEDASVDVVTTRSVLIYVGEKERAIGEFHRVLRPGGRMSLFEPINRLNRFRDVFDTGEPELAGRVWAVFDELQPRETDPMTSFDDRDLVDLAERAGFGRVQLTLEVAVEPPEPVPWETFVNVAWNPRIPTLAEAMEVALTPDERALYESRLRPLVESGEGSRRMAVAYLLGVKSS